MRLCFTCIPGKSAWELKKNTGTSSTSYCSGIVQFCSYAIWPCFYSKLSFLNHAFHPHGIFSIMSTPRRKQPPNMNWSPWTRQTVTVSLIQFRGFRSLFSICYHSSPSIPPPLLPNITKPFLLDFYLTQWESTTRPTPSHLCKTQGVHRKKPPFLTSFPPISLICLFGGWKNIFNMFPKWWWNMVIYHGRK